MMDSEGTLIFGLPAEFELTQHDAQALAVDDLISSVSLELGIFNVFSALGTATRAASERGDDLAAEALQLLLVVSSFHPRNAHGNPYGSMSSGSTNDGRPWRNAIPEDLSGAHLAALRTLGETIVTPVLKARIADVLWIRTQPREPRFARQAIDAYLAVAEDTFDPDHWTVSDDHLARAFTLANLLGRASPERALVVTTAFAFLARLDAIDSLYYTHHLIELLLPIVSEPAELEDLLARAREIIARAEFLGDFNRARAYYDVAIPLAGRLQHRDTAASLRLARAETHVSEALNRPTEMLRSIDLRVAVQELRRAGAARPRRDEVAQLLDEAQSLAVYEMVSSSGHIDTDHLSRHARDLVRGCHPVEGLWRLAGAGILQTRDAARSTAEQTLERNRFAFGFNRRHLASDGRTEGETPGSIGATDESYEMAVEGAMRFNAGFARVTAAFGVIEPARQELVANHDYSLNEIRIALSSRILIPRGHELLWARGIHAGLIGDYDVAIHILAPQIEHALREVLRSHGRIVYSTSDSGIQSLYSLERVLSDLAEGQLLDSGMLFALEAALGERLGANMRNSVAHGLIGDAAAQSADSAYIWWLALRLLRVFGSDPIVDLEISS